MAVSMTDTEVKALVDKLNRTHQMYQDELNSFKEVRLSTTDLKQASGETQQKLAQLETVILETNHELKTLQTILNRPSMNVTDSKFALSEERKTAFNKALRYGWGALNADERKHVIHDHDAGIKTTQVKALFGADATTGGFLAVPEYAAGLIMAIILTSPMHEIVDMQTIGGPYFIMFKRTATTTAKRIAEQSTRTETPNQAFGVVQVFPYESFAETLVSRTNMDDSEIDLGTFVMNDFATQFAKLEGNEMINGLGAGAGQCQGFLTETAITSTATVTAAAGAIDFASLVKLKHSLKTGYRTGAYWIWTTETFGQIISMTDTQGRPLWVPMGADVPDRFFGYPYAEMPDMPQTAQNGGSASAYAVAFGNFKQGYQGVIRKQVSIQVLQERYADQNAVGYLGYYRFGGAVKLAEAIKVLQIHA